MIPQFIIASWLIGTTCLAGHFAWKLRGYPIQWVRLPRWMPWPAAPLHPSVVPGTAAIMAPVEAVVLGLGGFW